MKTAAPWKTPPKEDDTGGKPTTALYAIGTRFSGGAISLMSGVLALALLDIDRIGIFLVFFNLAGFSAIGDLGLNYSFLLAISSKPRSEAVLLRGAALTALMPIVVATGFLLLVGGALFLREGGVPAERWLGPWIAYCALASLLQPLVLAVNQAEGTGRRHAAWRANFWIEVSGGLTLLFLIALRYELWALSISVLVKVILIGIWFGGEFRDGTIESKSADFRARTRLWLAQLWPMQWKNLINNTTGLVTTRLLTPVLLATQGASTAGRVGVALTLAIALMGITSAWPVSQTALYTALYHQGRAAELRAVFRSTSLRSTLLSATLCAGAGILCEIMRAFSPHMAVRLPDSVVLWILLAAAPLGHLTVCFAILVRSQRRDPVVVANFLLTIPTLIAYWFAAKNGSLIFAATYLLFALLFTGLYAHYARQLLVRMRATTAPKRGS
jgi:hypothetical protein